MKRLRNKKVLIMDDLKGSGIEQAIFIIREGEEWNEDSLVEEAQKIIDRYLLSMSAPPRKRLKTAVLLTAGTFIIALTLFLYYFFRV